jgi:glycosyltransferase involved in cell wall biosynthesis
VRLGLPRARRLVFPSQAAADLISQYVDVPRERVRVVHYGISVDTFSAGTAPETDAARYVFLPAAVEKHKNLRVLIESLPLVKDRELELWVAGVSKLDPEHRGELEALARELRVADRVRFLGAVPYREVLGYYRGATAFVFPSFIETFGHPLLEAMLVGTPVVASDIPTFREIAGEAALYFPPRDAEALARALDRVQDDAAATRSRVEIGRARVAQFSWKRSVDGLCAVFDEVLRER